MFVRKDCIFVLLLLTVLWSCKSLSQTNLDSTLEDYQQELLGVWVMENNPETKMEFLDNGTVNYYYDNELRKSENYQVTNSCGEETLNNGIYFLKRFSNDNNPWCDYIEQLNFENSNWLVLMSKCKVR